MKNNSPEKGYGDFVVQSEQYVSQWDGLVAGIAFGASGMHVVLIDFEAEAHYELIAWSAVEPEGLFQPSPKGDWLLRCVDEVVIDHGATELTSNQQVLRQRMMEAIYGLCEHLNLRVRSLGGDWCPKKNWSVCLGVRQWQKLDGKQRSFEVAFFGYQQKQQFLLEQCWSSCRKLLNDSPEEEGASYGT